MLNVMWKNENKGKYPSDKVGHAVENVGKTKHRDRLRKKCANCEVHRGKKNPAQIKKKKKGTKSFYFFAGKASLIVND